MNVFYLDQDLRLCAEYHSDVHVISQLKEAAQILSTTCDLLGHWREGMNKPTHKTHPCCKWAARSIYNVEWLTLLAFELNKEFGRRRVARGQPSADHKSIEVVAEVWEALYRRAGIPTARPTTPPQVVPVKYRVKGDTIGAYRAYYIAEKSMLKSSNGKLAPAVWTLRGPPPWWPTKIDNIDPLGFDDFPL